MNRITAEFITDPRTQDVIAALEANGHGIFFVGGCVRNALIGAPVSDIDLATDAEPNAVMRSAEAAGLRVVATGVDHGTVTVVAHGLAHEVTTFRKDIETDGRRAVVAFSTDIADDARRRDFTINALYADAKGHVIDPLGEGVADLLARRVRFIEDANQRIEEDFLRALRYFRFYAWYGRTEQGPDPDALAAIAANIAGVLRLPAERIGSEMLKLFAAPDPAPAVAAMAQTGLLAQLLPGADAKALAPLVDLEERYRLVPDPLRRLAALGDLEMRDRLRLSRAQAHRLAEIGAAAREGLPPVELGYHYGAEIALDGLILRASSTDGHLPTAVFGEIAEGVTAEFPVRAADLQDRFQGPALGEALRKLEHDWIASRFELSKSDLLARSRGLH